MALIAPPTMSLKRQLTEGGTDGDGMEDAVDLTTFPAISAASATAPANVYEIYSAGITDPGVAGKQNQDDYFIWQSSDGQTVIAGVFDGHGRELGQMAAKVARQYMVDRLSSPDVLARLKVEPKEVLEASFRGAHQAIEASFRKYYEDAGWVVHKTPEGYLTRAKSATSPSMCIHGGTTGTVLLILEGRRLLVSNVGDSTAIICGLGQAGELKRIEEWAPIRSAADSDPRGASSGAAAVSASSSSGGASGSSAAASLTAPMPPAISSSYMELSADHSPESASEFSRMSRFRAHATRAHHPELLFVYDTLSQSKLSCPPIFDVNTVTGIICKTERGSYYKNVRCEWATLVATPPHAPFQDALAFTRSLGDLHLQTYGVTHLPETWWMDLTVSATAAAQAGGGSGGGAAAAADGALSVAEVAERPLVPNPIAISLCSDGVWDNWKYEEVASFVLHGPRMRDVLASRSAETAVGDLMKQNLERARANFGSSADNMTAISVYLFPK